MADDHEYPHQVEVDDFEEDDSASSSDLEPAEPAQELLEEDLQRDASHAPSSRSGGANGHGSKSKHGKGHGSDKEKAPQAVRRPKNLEVEVAGPTEDVRSLFHFHCS